MSQTAVERKAKGSVASRVPPAIEVRRGEMQPKNLPEMLELAHILSCSSIIPQAFQGKRGDILVAIQMGAEVGLSPMAALRGICVINGRPSLWGDALVGIVRARPDCEDVIESFDAKTMMATCIVKRRGASPVTQTFSKDDAVTAKLWGKSGPWTQYPKRMLQMRARGFALRDAFADALGGISMAEESQDLSASVGPAPPPLQSSDFELIAEAVDTGGEQQAESDPEPEAAKDPGEPTMSASESGAFAKELRRLGAYDAFEAEHGKPPDWPASLSDDCRAAIRAATEKARAS